MFRMSLAMDVRFATYSVRSSFNYFNVILTYTLVYSKWSLSLRFSQQHHVCISPLPCTGTSSAHFLGLITRKALGQEYRLLSSYLFSFTHSHVTSPPLGPNILLSTLFSKPLSLRSSLNVSDHVSHTYKTRGKIIIRFIIIFIFLDNKQEDKRLRN